MPVFAKYDDIDGESENASDALNLDYDGAALKSAINTGANDIIRGTDGDDVIAHSTSGGGFCVDEDGSFADRTPSDEPTLDAGNDTIFGGRAEDDLDDILILNTDEDGFDGGYCIDHDPYTEARFDLSDPIFRALDEATEPQSDMEDPGTAMHQDSGEAHLDYLTISL